MFNKLKFKAAVVERGKTLKDIAGMPRYQRNVIVPEAQWEDRV